MQYHQSKLESQRPQQQKPILHPHDTSESGYNELIYMDPTLTQMMSPVTEGRQTLPRSPLDPLYSSVRIDLGSRGEASVMGEKPIHNLPFTKRYEPSPKTINVGESRQQREYNIRTINRRSPNVLYSDNNIIMDQPINNNETFGYQDAGGGFQYESFKVAGQSPILNTNLGNINANRNLIGNRISPGSNNNISGLNKDNYANNSTANFYGNASRERGDGQNEGSGNNSNQGKQNFITGNFNYNSNNGSYNSINQSPNEINNQSLSPNNPAKNTYRYNNPTYSNMTINEVKNLVKRFTKVYDPKKTREGALISQSQIIVPGANDYIFNNRYKVLQKMNRLSNILLSKKNLNKSPNIEEIMNKSIESQKKTFDRHTLNKNSLSKQKNKISMRSPDRKFFYISLAMMSSKGPNTEDRTILRRMRFDKGGVVDLAQEERKKGKYKIRKVTNKRNIRNTLIIKPNPKYREQAAKLIQNWWRELKELYKMRYNMIVKIQSFWRGRWVRKYMYDILYLSFMYQSFCQIIQKVLVKHIRPYIFDLLMENRKKVFNVLRNLLISKNNRFMTLRIKFYFDKWINYIKQSEVRNLRGRKLFDIRNENERRINLLSKKFDKWVFISKVNNLKRNFDDVINVKNKYISIGKILDGCVKLGRKIAFKNLKNNILDYLRIKVRNEILKNIINNITIDNKDFIRKIIKKWLNNIKEDNSSEFKKKLSIELFENALNRISNNLIKSTFSKLSRIPKKEIIEKILIQEKTLEKENKIKGIHKNYLEASFLLENAILRLNYKDPLNAISEKINNYNINEKLIKCINLKEKVFGNILRKSLFNWYNNVFEKKGKKLINELIMRLLDNILKKIKQRILSNKLNQWKSILINKEDSDNLYKKLKGIDKLSLNIKSKIIKNYGNEFLNNLKKTINSRIFQSALLRIIENYFNKDRNKLRNLMNKWRNQCRKIENKILISKLIYSLGNRNDMNNRKLILSKFLNKWLTIINNEKLIKQGNLGLDQIDNEKKNISALIMKIIKRNIDRNNNENIIRNIINKWLEKIKKEKEKYNSNVIKGINLLKKYNSILYFQELMNKLKENLYDSIENEKIEQLKKLIPKRNKIENLILLINLYKWKSKIQKKEDLKIDIFKQRYLKNIITKNNKNQMTSALYKWKSNIKQKINNVPKKIGLNILNKTLLKGPFKKIKETKIKKVIQIPKDLTLKQALLIGDLVSAKSLSLKRIPLLHYFLKWKNIIKKEKEINIKRELFNKIILRALKKKNNNILRKYFNRWKDNIIKRSIDELEKTIFMKLMRNIYYKTQNNIMKNKINLWKNIINKISNKEKNTIQAFENLRKILTNPVFEKVKIKKQKIPVNSKLKSIIINNYLSNKRNNLSKYINKWRKILDKEKENELKNKIKTQILSILINQQNIKKENNLRNKLREILLKWRIKSPLKDNVIEKIKNIRKGFELLINSLRKSYSNTIYNGIKERKKFRGSKKIISKIISEINPKIKRNILRKYLNIWKNKLPNKKEDIQKIKNFFNSIIDNSNFKSKKNEPYKKIIEILKEILKNKNQKAQKIINFFRKIKYKSLKKKLEERNTKLKNLITKKDNLNILRLYFAKLRRITRKEKAINDALIIRKFCKIKLNLINRKRNKINDFVNAIKKRILIKIFNQILGEGKNKRILLLLKKLFDNKEKGNKKTIKENLLKWKTIIPLLKKINSIIKIQSVFRGMKTRKNKNNKKTLINNLKEIFNRKDNNKNLLRYYLFKWNLRNQKEKCDDKVKKIQRFLIKKKNKINIKNTKKKLEKLFRKYYLKKIKDILRRLKPVDKKRYNQIIVILDKIIKKRINDFIFKMKKYIILKKLRNIYPKIINALKKYYLPLYLRKWKIISIDERDKRIKKIQNYLKKNLINKKAKSKQKFISILKFLVNIKDENKKSKLKNILYIWIKNSRKITLNINAQIIQKFCKLKQNKKTKQKLDSQFILKLLLRKYLFYQIKNNLKETNNYIKLINEALNKVKGVDKRYITNNLISYTNDNIRRKLLLNILTKLNQNNKDNILRKFLLKWKKISDIINLKAILIQKFFRKIKMKNKNKSTQRINEIFLNLFLKHDSTKKDKIFYYMRKWMLNSKKLGCKINSDKIKIYLNRKLNEKIKRNINKFLIKLIKKLLGKKLKDIIRIKKLKDSIIKFFIKKIINNIKNYGISNKKISVLKSTIKLRGSKFNIILSNYLNLWKNKIKILKEKEKNYSIIIQKFLKKLKEKNKNVKSIKKLNLLKQIILLHPKKNSLRVYFNKFRTNIKKIELQENADIIKNFCRIVKKRKDNERENKLRNNINKAMDILSKFNPNKKYAFDKIKNVKTTKILKQLFDFVNKKRNNNLKDAFDKIKSTKNKNKIMKIIIFRKNFNDKILKNNLKKWLEQINLLKKKLKEEKNRNDKIKSILTQLLNKKENDIKNKLSIKLLKYLSTIKKLKLNESATKIQNYLIKKTKVKKIKKLWENISNLLSLKISKGQLKQIINKLQLYIIYKKLINQLNERMKLSSFNNLISKLKLKKIFSILKNFITKIDNNNKNIILKKYLNKWNNIIQKLKSKNEIIEKMLNTIDKRRKIISTQTIMNVILIKKLLHDILRIRALYFFRKLKKIFELKKRFSALGDSLIKTKENFQNQNKKKFILKIYKIYYMKLIEKMFNKIKENTKKIKKSNLKLFFKLLKLINNKKSENKYSTIHQGSNDNNIISKLQFRAHISSPQNNIIKNRNIHNYIIPLFIDYLNKKLLERKKYVFEKIKANDRNNKLIELIRKYIKKSQIENKRNFLNKLLSNNKKLQNRNSLLSKFKNLFKKYYLYILITQIKSHNKTFKIFYLLKMTFMHMGISQKRFTRELLRKWRFISFVKIITKRKLELLYKNLHISYLQIANDIFGEENNNESIIKEFERFGSNVGLFKNETYDYSQESSFCRKVNKKYIFDTLETDNIKLMEEYYNENYRFNRDFIIKENIALNQELKKEELSEDEKEVIQDKKSRSHKQYKDDDNYDKKSFK